MSHVAKGWIPPNLVIATTLLLAACGGGGGGGGDLGTSIDVPTEPLTLTDSNADETAGSVLEIQDFTASLIESPDLIPVLSGGVDAPADGGLDFDLKSFSESIVERVTNTDVTPTDALTVAVVISDSLDCANTGSVSIVWNDADDNDAPSTGDSATVDFDQCSDDGITFIDGGISVALTAFDVDPATSEILALDWSFSVDALTVTGGGETILLDGGYQMSLSYNQATQVSDFNFRGNRLAASYTSPTEAEAFALTSFDISYSEDSLNGTYVYDADYTLASTDIGGVVTVTTDPSFEGTLDFSTLPPEPNYPTIGAVLIEGDAGTTVLLDADNEDPDTADVVITTADATVITRTVLWTEIDNSI